MAKQITYPNYSVYLVSGGALKIPYSMSKRVVLYDRYEARRAMANVANKYKWQAVVMRYDAPYEGRIIEMCDAGPIFEEEDE